MNRKRSTKTFRLIGSRFSFDSSPFLYLAKEGAEVEREHGADLGEGEEALEDADRTDTADQVASVFRFGAAPSETPDGSPLPLSGFRRRDARAPEAGSSPKHCFRPPANDTHRTGSSTGANTSPNEAGARDSRQRAPLKRARRENGRTRVEETALPSDGAECSRGDDSAGKYRRVRSRSCTKRGAMMFAEGRFTASKVVAPVMVEGRNSLGLERFTPPGLTRFHLLKFPN